MTPTKTCDFGLLDANPHCRRGALLVTYPTFVGGAGRVVELLPGGKLDESAPVDLPDDALASFRFLAIAVDPRGPRYFVINSVHAAEAAPSVGELWVRARTEQSLVMEYIPLASDKSEMADLRGIAFDTKRERLYVSTPYTLWAWDLGAPSWQAIATDMDFNLTGLAYSPDEDVIYAVKNGGVAIYRFASDGKLLDRIPVKDPDFAKRPVHFFEQVMLDHGTLVMIGEAEGPHKLLSLSCLVVDLKTGNVLRDGCWR
jgi:hypothetical protein